jgi:hypothetical protein
LKILQLLLHCGMVCQEELKLVLEMIPTDSEIRAVAVQDPAQEPVQEPKETSEPQPRQNALILEFD